MSARPYTALFACIFICLSGTAADAEGKTPAPKNAYLYFHSPLNGMTVPQRFTVRIGLRDMGVAPAGVEKSNTGHHHLLVDVELPNLNEPLPNDPNHLHLGNGQTEIRLSLPPGQHTLQLVLGDHDHVPHDPPIVSKKISIRVRADDVHRARDQ